MRRARGEPARAPRRGRAAAALLPIAALLFAAACASCASPRAPDTTALPELVLAADDTRIDRSVRIRPGTYAIADADGDGVLHIVADGVVLDLSGVTLVGSFPGADPDQFTGIGVRAAGVSRATIRHGAIRGFKVAIEIDGGSGHTLLGSDLSGNFRQRLGSTPDAEDPDDWLWPHENDGDEWTRNYGAGLHLKGVSESEVRSVTVRRGQNGIILSRCSSVEVRECDASFLSGWGLALWRTTDSTVEGNRFDWCVRGYSHGVYARGQDSTGILVFEQCSRNVFRANSATHGGDGFFLFAGKDTLEETGEGGSNENLVVGNDFSHAVANGIEATFSAGNHFAGNILRDCNYGVWAGYSSETWVTGNEIADSSIAGVAIEHGQGNAIGGNRFSGNAAGVSLWWDEDPDLAASAFGSSRSTESAENWIHANRFEGNRVAISLRDADSTRIGRNEFVECGEEVRSEGRGTVRALVEDVIAALDESLPTAPPGRQPAFLPEGARRGRDRIFVDEWGPYDFVGVRAWPTTIEGTPSARVHLLGSDLPYRIDAIAGDIIVEPRDGTLPATVRVRPDADAAGVVPFSFVALSDGGEISVRGSLLAIPWTVRYHAWESAGAGEPPADFAVVRASAPLAEERRGDLDLRPGSGSPAAGVPADHFATVATSAFTLPPGRYEVRLLSDDGVRVRLDGRTIHEDWTWHAPREATVEVELGGGEHALEVEHFEIDGHAALRLVLVPVAGER